MKPIVILSTDTTPDYLYCLPITAKAWELQGWDVDAIIVCKHPSDIKGIGLAERYIGGQHEVEHVVRPEEFENNPSLYAQCVRLFTPMDFFDDDQYCILGDVDMLLGSDFLNRDFDKVNVFGHDLTGREHIPMCYCGMTVGRWAEVMGDDKMHAHVNQYCDLTDKVKAWVCDQDILTARLKEYGYGRINFVDRGTDPNNSNLPIGRQDRYNNMKRPEGVVHDVHLMRKPWEHVEKIIEICTDLYPKEDWGWIRDYTNEFKREMNL